MTTKQKGDINELRCMTKFVELGFTVSKPISDDSKYDFVIEKEGKFLRMQAKKSRYTNVRRDFLKFGTVSVHYRNGSNVKGEYTEKDIDYFCTENNGNVYIVPVGETTGKTAFSMMLKDEANKNANTKKINLASNYLVNKVLGCEDVNEYETERVVHKPNVECERCGRKVYRTRPNCGSFICPRCAAEIRRGIKRPEKEVLESEIKDLSYVDIGRKYKVSATTIKKWANDYGIILPVKHRHFLTPPVKLESERIHTVPVSQWRKDGSFVRLYRGFKDTERYGFNKRAVSKCCHGGLKTYRGFIWKIESNENPKVISSLKGTSGVFEQKSVFEHCDSREVVVPRMDKGTDS